MVGESNGRGYQDLWQCLWKLNVPNQIIFSLWMACADAIACGFSLFRRTILSTGLWFCNNPKRVWKLMEFYALI